MPSSCPRESSCDEAIWPPWNFEKLPPAHSDINRDDRVALWEQGTPVATCVLKFADARLRAQQIAKRGTPESRMIELLMMADVFCQLTAGELTAMGYQTAPAVSDGPIPIPSDLFEERPPGTIWHGCIDARGYSFEGVRVQVARLSAVENAVAPATSLEKANRGGRPTKKGAILKAYDALNRPEDRLWDWAAKDRAKAIREHLKEGQTRKASIRRQWIASLNRTAPTISPSSKPSKLGFEPSEVWRDSIKAAS